MTRQKLFLVAAATLFIGWMSYLGYAVIYHRLNPPEVVSRSQIAGAEFLVVAEVTTAADGRPNPTVTVTHRLSDNGPPDGTIEVTNLPDARPPSMSPFPGPGQYLLPLETNTPTSFRVAGWPRSPGMPAFEPGQKLGESSRIRPPLVYRWNDGVQKQLAGWGYEW